MFRAFLNDSIFLFMTENIYEQFITYLKTKQGTYPTGTPLEKHRVIPGHAGGTYEDGENVICISHSDHALAHFYRFLAYGEKPDKVAYLFMVGKSDEAAHALCVLGGSQSAAKHKEKKSHFWDPEWQREFGDRNGGQRNVKSGSLDKLNRMLTTERPYQRSDAGKKGGKACTEKQKADKKHFFDEKSRIQKRANLVRWGIVINGVRIPFEKLSSDFVDYHIEYGTQKSY